MFSTHCNEGDGQGGVTVFNEAVIFKCQYDVCVIQCKVLRHNIIVCGLECEYKNNNYKTLALTNYFKHCLKWSVTLHIICLCIVRQTETRNLRIIL